MPDASKLELQFYFSDDSQTMDAIVRNENEKELLALLKGVISTFGFPITIGSEALSPGAYKQGWSFAGDNVGQVAAVLTLATSFIGTKPKKDSKGDLDGGEAKEEKGVVVQKKKALLDKAKKELREDEKLQPDTLKEVITMLEANPRLIWHRSNFYKKINPYQRIERFSTSLSHDGNVVAGSEKMVARKNFKSFIVNSNELPPNVDEDAVVEIVAPVLTTAKSKWKGIYKGASITFDMKDDDFKKSVFSQQIEFKNGVAIKCVLQLVQRIDGRGVIKTKSTTVLNVVGIINPDSALSTRPSVIVATAVTEKTKPTALIQEPALAPIQKKVPKVDERQLDMFG